MKTEILRSISYFDIFNHPLQKKELANLCLTASSQKEDFEAVLEDLVRSKKCYKQDEFYSLNENITHLINQRSIKEGKANAYFQKLPFYTKLLKSFPFVKGLAISGSLSKNVMYEDGDIDYFVITAPNRLWICRTLLVLFKKVFLLNSKKYFCVNYFIDENNLEIIDKNIFTATEVTFLAPIYNQKLIDELKKKNSWTKNYLPNFKHPLNLTVMEGDSFIKKSMEFPLKGRLGEYLDLFFMKLTYRQWSKKFKHFDAEKFELTMRTNRGISKHHPRDFQNKVLEQLSTRLNQLGIN